MSITIDVSEVLERIDPEKMERALEVAVDGAIDNAIRPEFRRYPGGKPGPMQWKSEKQRRWFFWALRTGQIQVPYGRTGDLGRQWTKRVRRVAGGIRGVIGSDTPYAKWVINEPSQAQIHRGRWYTVQKVAEQQADAVKRFIEQALARWAR